MIDSAILADKSLVVALGRLITAKEKAGCLAEGPLQVNVADFGVLSRLHPFACRLVRALYQPSVGDEIADFREAADIVNLILNYKSKDLSDTRYAAKQGALPPGRVQVPGR